MSDIHDQGELSGDELLAAEYALGVLAGPERAAAERRIARERAFAALVVAWDERLSPWAAEIGEVAPPAQVWDRIAAALPAAPARRASIWDSLAFWRGLALAGALAAASLGALLYVGALTQKAPLIAAIEGGGHRIFVATIDAKRRTIAVVPAEYSGDLTHVAELWLLPPGGKPLPVGLLRADRTVVLEVSAALAAKADERAALAVSLEPPGGSPTGQPTGRVIGSGKLTNL